MQGSAAVPAGDPVYRFLDRCAARGIIPLQTTTTQPLSRIEIGRMLMQINSDRSEIEDRTIRADIDYFIKEFAWDIDRFSEVESLSEIFVKDIKEIFLSIFSISQKESDLTQHWHMSATRKGKFHFIFDPLIWAEYNISENDTNIFRRATGIQFRGSFDNWLGYYFRFIDHVERGNGPYDSRDKLLNDKYGYVGPINHKQKETYYDLTEVYLNTAWKGIDLTFGKDRVAWGASGEGGLLLSGVAPSFNQLRIAFQLTNDLRFTYLVGQMHPSDDIVGDTLYVTDRGWTRYNLVPKWLAAHRLEYSPWEPVLLSVSEAIIWGNRGLDPAYLNPLYFFYSAEHDGGDQDNVLMAGDIRIRIAQHAIVYGELLIDDLKTSTIGTGDIHNKIGLTAGGWLYRTGFDGLELGLEYQRLEPYVYSHFFPINRYTTWTSSLGSDLLPNSDRIRWQVRYRPVRSLELYYRMDINRHGRSGGDINETVQRGEPSNVNFLDGFNSEWATFKASAKWELKPGLQIEAGWINNKFIYKTVLPVPAGVMDVVDYERINPNRVYISIGYRYFGL